MHKFFGKGVFAGIAIGRVSVFARDNAKVVRQKIVDTDAEQRRFEAAKKAAHEQLDKVYQKALDEVGRTNADIFAIHKMMLDDEDFNESVIGIIKSQQVNAEYAIALTADNFAKMFATMNDSYMRARGEDVHDISNRLIRALEGGDEGRGELFEKCIICADDLAPSETVTLDKSRVLAFVTSHGSANSHTAILARNMNIPAVIGAGDEFLNTVSDGDMLIVNGTSGEVILNPGLQEISIAEQMRSEEHKKRALLERLRGKDNVTKNGKRIDVFANIGSVDSIGEVLHNDAGGIGLFRSEFLYLEKSDYPSEEEQFCVYRRVLESMAGKRVIIRTLDIGADKQVGYFGLAKEENPALGLRAIRLCLTREDLFKTQLRALYRASAYGRLGIMFPMISSVWEVQKINEICRDVKAELEGEGFDLPNEVELGIMIETPAAAIISEKLAPLVDFFSVGTNDLTQYTLACDRQNPALEPFCDTHHEAVLRLIKYAADSAHKYGKWIGICGELAGDTDLTQEFIRMGIDELSVSPPYVLRVREAVRELDL